jgi:glycosyltransferase involved in cell wall biosynthesis
MGAQPELSVVVPVFNAEATLPKLVAELEGVLGSDGWELVLVNDGSRDRSWEVIQALAGRFPWIRGFNLMRNYGQHNALLCGIRAARGRVIVTMDDDLQNPPAEIPRLLAKLEEGYDVVYGTPRRQQHGLLRNLASSVTKLALQSAMGAETARSVSAFRAFRSEVREAFAEYRGAFVSIDVLLTWGTQHFAAIPVECRPRTIGVSHYTVGKLIAHALNMITGFSTLPLQMASILGFLMTFFGFAILVYVVGRYLVQGGSVPGFPFLASLIAIFSGAQMFGLGVIGEYIARIHARTMDKPSYTVRSVTRQAE